MLRALQALALFTLTGIGLGYLGPVWPPGDSLSVARVQLALLLVLLAPLLWWRGARLAAAAAALALSATAASTLPAVIDRTALAGGAGSGGFTLYQKNLLAVAWPRYDLADDIVDSGAEVVTLQEVSAHNRRFMARLFDHYPTQVACPSGQQGDVAVLSLWPAVPGTAHCAAGSGLALVRLQPPGGEPSVWIAAIHLHWPWPWPQDAASRGIADTLAGLDGPLVVAGDFNMQPWGASLSRIARAARTRRAGPVHVTFPELAPLLPLAIDHVLVPRGWTATTSVRPELGSDHRGVLARIEPG